MEMQFLKSIKTRSFTLILLVLSVVWISSCKKEKEVVPDLKKNSSMEELREEFLPYDFNSIKLQSTCSPEPTKYRKWLITNQGEKDIFFKYSLDGTTYSSLILLKAKSEMYFDTPLRIGFFSQIQPKFCAIYVGNFKVTQCPLDGISASVCPEIITQTESQYIESMTEAVGNFLSMSGNSESDTIKNAAYTYALNTYGKSFESMYNDLHSDIGFNTLLNGFTSEGKISTEAIRSALGRKYSGACIDKVIQLTQLADSYYNGQVPPEEAVSIITQRLTKLEESVKFNPNLSLNDKKFLMSISRMSLNTVSKFAFSSLGNIDPNLSANARLKILKDLGKLLNVVLYTSMFAVSGAVGGAVTSPPMAILGAVAGGVVGFVAASCQNGWIKNCSLYY